MNKLSIYKFLIFLIITTLSSAARGTPIEDARHLYKAGNYKGAISVLIPLGEEGNVEAQFVLGVIYTNGLGLPNVPVDHPQALSWFTKAAEKNYVPAQIELGTIYSDGVGVPKDYSQGMNWYLKAANQGDPYAQYDIGNLYRVGKGVSQDYAKALFWYRKAADQDFGGAQYALGDLSAHGEGTPQDVIQAYKWYSLALSRIEVPFIQAQVRQSRNELAGKMTPSQITDALRLVDDWHRDAQPR